MTGGAFSLKLKTKNGTFVLKELSADLTVGEFKLRIGEATGIPAIAINILKGFPPRPIDLSDSKLSIGNLGIIGGETLIVEAKRVEQEEEEEEAEAAYLTSTSRNILETDAALARCLQEESNNSVYDARPSTSINGTLRRRQVPADNSCLFSSIRFVLKGSLDLKEGSELMRHIIAQEVSSNPDVYNDAILGKSNSEYCAWIQKPDSWGGAIEVSILSNYYGIEIDVIDAQNAIINRFGEDKNFSLRVFLLFDGIHYDPLYIEPTDDTNPITLFPTEDEEVYAQAEQLAREAKSSRQYTNVDKFTLRCQVCGTLLVGHAQAQVHAKNTGHCNFGEI